MLQLYNQATQKVEDRLINHDEKMVQTFPRIGSFEIYFMEQNIFSKLKTGQWPQPDRVILKIIKMMNNINKGKKWDDGLIPTNPGSHNQSYIEHQSVHLQRATRSFSEKKNSLQNMVYGQQYLFKMPDYYASNYGSKQNLSNYNSKQRSQQRSQNQTPDRTQYKITEEKDVKETINEDDYQEDFEEVEENSIDKSKHNQRHHNMQSQGEAIFNINYQDLRARSLEIKTKQRPWRVDVNNMQQRNVPDSNHKKQKQIELKNEEKRLKDFYESKKKANQFIREMAKQRRLNEAIKSQISIKDELNQNYQSEQIYSDQFSSDSNKRKSQQISSQIKQSFNQKPKKINNKSVNLDFNSSDGSRPQSQQVNVNNNKGQKLSQDSGVRTEISQSNLQIRPDTRKQGRQEKEKEKEVVIHKIYEIKLDLNKTNKKSSHPNEMQLKNDNAVIKAQDRQKIGLIFPEQSQNDLSRQYVIFIKKNGMAFENILLNIIYDS